MEQQQERFSVRLNDGREFGPASMELIVQWTREGRVPQDALLVSAEGGAVQSVLSEPSLQAVLQAPPTISSGVQPPGDAPMSGMIPYKNPPALIGYYVAIISLIPVIGLLAGPIAIVLGIIGVRRRMKEPKVRGLAHAWIAIIGGVIGILITVGCVGPAIMAGMSR